MRISSIDIGTNTILLLIADTDGDKITKIIHDEQVIARLGKGVDRNRVINSETFHRVAEFLSAYNSTSLEFRSAKVIAVGTSALREASNKEEFCNAMRQKTGIDIEVLSGNDEAEWTYRGALQDMNAGAGNFTVLDIGGGSTEIISGTSTKILSKASLDVGCVRITERFLRSSPPTSLEVSQARSYIRGHLKSVGLAETNLSRVVGVAGTLTTLAAIHLQLPQYDPSRVEGHVLNFRGIREVFDQLRSKTLAEIRSIPQISTGRADIILAGVLILLEFMEAAHLERIAVSDRGLRYGIVMRELERGKSTH
jgi:exopolyphosphatase/guanosine-5'-triphosphate,3'-diphosphate pyrophosphatase